MNEPFWARLERVRKERDVSEDAVAKDCFMHRNAYREARKAKSSIGVEFLDGIARVLDVNVHYLVTGFGEPGAYIPASVPAVDESKVYREVENYARSLNYSPLAVSLVLNQKPDARLGAERISELCARASEMIVKRDGNARKAKRTPSKPSASRRSPHG